MKWLPSLERPNLDPFPRKLVKLFSSHPFKSCSYTLLFYMISNIYVCTFPRRTIRLQHMANSTCPLYGPNSVNNSPFVSLSYTKCNSMFTYFGLIRSISISGVTMRLQAISIPTKSIHIKRFVRPLVS